MAALQSDWIAAFLTQTMFGIKARRELDPPPLATRNAEAVEVLRVWASSGDGPEVVLKTTWKDAGAWGLMLADIARHAANAHEGEGHDRGQVLARIRQRFDEESAGSTGGPVEI